MSFSGFEELKHRPVRGPDAKAGEGGALERLANRHCHEGGA